MKTARKYYVLERNNPQLGTHFYPLGPISKTYAKARAKTLYGTNKVHAFDTASEAMEFIRIKRGEK